MTFFADSTEIIDVKVLRLLPFGILVGLEDGREGIIREREIAWDRRKRRNWRQRFKVGDALNAVKLGEGHDQRLEFSLRLIEKDPWVDLGVRYPLGKVVEGTITGVQHYGVFVELEPGIIGLLHATRLPGWAQSRDNKELFWLGDRVKVAIERIDPKNRQIGLTLARALNHRWENTLAASAGVQLRNVEANPSLANLAQEQEAPALPSWSLLVVEDDPVQLGTMTKWMQQSGLETRMATSAEDALIQIEQTSPDLVLTDFGLPGLSGISLIEQIRRRWPAIRCALMTDWTRVSEHSYEIDALRAEGTPLLIKPLRPADIVGLLTESFDAIDEADVTAPTPKLPLMSHPDRPRSALPWQRQINDHLARLCSSTGAEKAVVFLLDAAQGTVNIVAEAGATDLNTAATIDLIHSPVRDVAEDRQVFREENAGQVEARVRYLKPLLPFRSCLGLPLPAQLPDRYALFLFSPRRRAFSELHEAYATATALAAGALLEREQFRDNVLEMQSMALLGQLSRALVHEINHQLSPINFVLDNLIRQFGVIEQGIARAPHTLDADISAMHEEFSDLTKSIQNLTETARVFGQITTQTKEQKIDLGEAIEEVVQLLRDMADRAGVRLVIDIPEDLPPAHIYTAQFQQILLNIMINAIQQIELINRPFGGRVLIRVVQQLRDHRPLFHIRIEDDGPGIHRQLWKRIFDLGFTTRAEGGSGMGLYITRGLVESLNGRVYIEESYILWGSAFVVELPVAS